MLNLVSSTLIFIFIFEDILTYNPHNMVFDYFYNEILDMFYKLYWMIYYYVFYIQLCKWPLLINPCCFSSCTLYIIFFITLFHPFVSLYLWSCKQNTTYLNILKVQMLRTFLLIFYSLFILLVNQHYFGSI